MTKGEMIELSRQVSPDNDHTYNRWLRANVAVASIFASALLGMALAGSDLSVSSRASASDAQTTGFDAPRTNRVDPATPHDMMVRYAPGELRVEQVDSPF